MSLLEAVPPNAVQPIRTFRVADLREEAARLEQRFLCADCAQADTKLDVLDRIASAFHFPKHFGKNFDALADCLTDLAYKPSSQPGFVVVIERLPQTPQFSKEQREILLEVFRGAADFWAEKNVAFRVFYSVR